MSNINQYNTFKIVLFFILALTEVMGLDLKTVI